jgi:hypothetical protein
MAKKKGKGKAEAPATGVLAFDPRTGKMEFLGAGPGTPAELLSAVMARIAAAHRPDEKAPEVHIGGDGTADVTIDAHQEHIDIQKFAGLTTDEGKIIVRAAEGSFAIKGDPHAILGLIEALAGAAAELHNQLAPEHPAIRPTFPKRDDHAWGASNPQNN